ncbi:MAG: helix-turn-helix transcriptional regulator [Clostridiales bacterium]|jgi:transcriptional regulator with XRE-family HTH domain|nr:helix-turn-helix transcriptional regulator [Clostridiales bacterium]
MAVDPGGTLGQVIKRKRLQLGISLRDLARAADVSHVTIMRIEDDKFNMVDPAILTAIADALHLDRLFLLSLNGAGVEDEDIRIIARAAGKMSPEQRRQMLAMLRGSFSEAFRNTASDDLDDKEDEYLDERV